MSFRARIFIQGVGVYVSEAGPPRRLTVLFPDSSQPHLTAKLPDGAGNAFRQHRAVVQYSERNLTPNAPDNWLTTSLAGCRLRIESNSQQPLAFAGPGPGLMGLPVLKDYLEAANLADVSPVDPARIAAATTATLVLDAGMIGPDFEYLGTWEWVDRRKRPWEAKTAEYASVMRAELGMVDRLELVIEPIDGSPPTRQALGPAAGVCDVWVRHDCDPTLSTDCQFVERPGPQPDSVRAGDVDLDFTLNFALSSDPARVLGAIHQDSRQARLPILRVHKSWRGGSPIGGWPQKCMGAQTW